MEGKRSQSGAVVLRANQSIDEGGATEAYAALPRNCGLFRERLGWLEATASVTTFIIVRRRNAPALLQGSHLSRSGTTSHVPLAPPHVPHLRLPIIQRWRLNRTVPLPLSSNASHTPQTNTASAKLLL